MAFSLYDLYTICHFTLRSVYHISLHNKVCTPFNPLTLSYAHHTAPLYQGVHTTQYFHIKACVPYSLFTLIYVYQITS